MYILSLFRSKVANWFLVLTAKSKDVAANREAFYEPFIQDLKKLEKGVSFNGGNLQAGVAAHFADNLEAHIVSGKSQNFSNGTICRICHLQVISKLLPTW